MIRNLTAPNKPSETNFSIIISLVKKHYQPTPSVIISRFNFNSRTRQSHESVADFIAQLRQLSEYCNFGTNLNDMLRDRLVVGINNDTIQERLLAEVDLTFEQAYNLAISSKGIENLETNLQFENEY